MRLRLRVTPGRERLLLRLLLLTLSRREGRRLLREEPRFGEVLW
jgi:hypothetical protein